MSNLLTHENGSSQTSFGYIKSEPKNNVILKKNGTLQKRIKKHFSNTQTVDLETTELVDEWVKCLFADEKPNKYAHLVSITNTVPDDLSKIIYIADKIEDKKRNSLIKNAVMPFLRKTENSGTVYNMFESYNRVKSFIAGCFSV